MMVEGGIEEMTAEGGGGGGGRCEAGSSWRMGEGGEGGKLDKRGGRRGESEEGKRSGGWEE